MFQGNRVGSRGLLSVLGPAIVLLGWPSAGLAKPISTDKAVDTARRFYQMRFAPADPGIADVDAQLLAANKRKIARDLTALSEKGVWVRRGPRNMAAGYQFDLPGGGCIVVSGDDRFPAIFFYSLVNTLDTERNPAASSWQTPQAPLRRSFGRVQGYGERS